MTRAEVTSLSGGHAPRVRWVRSIGMFERMAAADGVLYVVDDGTTAFDLRTGETLWHVEINGDNMSSGGVEIGLTPTSVQVHAPDEYYVEFDRSTGRRLSAASRRPRDFVAVETPEPRDCDFDDDGAVVGTAGGREVWRLELEDEPMHEQQLLAVRDLIVAAMPDQRIVVLE